MYFRLKATIFDLPGTPTSESIHTSRTVLLDIDNFVGVAIGSALPPATNQGLLTELQVFPVSRPPSRFPAEHGWILAWCDILSGSRDFSAHDN